MSVLTFKSEEYKTFPQVLRDYASYNMAIKGNSEKTICEYLLDLRTFFRYCIMKERGESFEFDSFEKISISGINLDDVRSVTPERIIEYLMFAGFERKNSPGTRMRKLSALKSFFHYAYVKKRYIDSNPTSDIDSPKKKQNLAEISHR